MTRSLLAAATFATLGSTAACTAKSDMKSSSGSGVTSATSATSVDAATPVTATTAHSPASGLYVLTPSSLEDAPQPLAQYAGKVALVVNVASECGYTPQYQGLEALYEAYAPRGFVVLGFPSNDFGEQEPGDGKEIRAFCSSKFHVTFPMFAKVKTSGPAQSPVYAFLTRTPGIGAPQWNFHKYLVGRDGQVIAAFPSAIEPTSDVLKHAIEAALAR